jgi:hypothetical protein
MKRVLILSILILSLGSCSSNVLSQLEQAVSVKPGEKAASCLQYSSTVNGTFIVKTTTYKRIELPDDFDVTTMNADSLEQVEESTCGVE